MIYAVVFFFFHPLPLLLRNLGSDSLLRMVSRPEKCCQRKGLACGKTNRTDDLRAKNPESGLLILIVTILHSRDCLRRKVRQDEVNNR